MNEFRVIVTGWRGWPEEAAGIIRAALDDVYWSCLPGGLGSLVVVHGESPCGGVDLWAHHWAITKQVDGGPVRAEPHPADFVGLGKRAGPLRNQEMVDLGAQLCLGFPGPQSRGTWDCLTKAVDADIHTLVTPWRSQYFPTT